MSKLDKLSIRGFKSIEKLEEFELGDLNVLIGANGSGKSNFVSFFRMLRAMVNQQLQAFVLKYGPVDGYFYNGVSHTKQIEADLIFGNNRYCFTLEPTTESQLFIAKEQTQYLSLGGLTTIGKNILESRLELLKDESGIATRRSKNYYVHQALSSWQVYHFHDTSMTAGMRRPIGIEQSQTLFPDASNLAAFLLNLRDQHADTYALVRQTLQRIAPYFDDFDLRVTSDQIQDQVRLTWRQKGTDYVFSPGHFSDGTIRFLCLVVALLQPNPPTTLVLDEPELGLHPEALSILGGLLRSAATRMQIIVATQSPLLLNEFKPEQVITVDQVNGASQFHRLNTQELREWLEDYSVGALWQKGTIRGGVNYG